MRSDLVSRRKRAASQRARSYCQAPGTPSCDGRKSYRPRLAVDHRYYDPSTDQFISVDPLVGVTGQAFSYANDNPVNGSDPSGMSFLGGLVDSFNPFSQHNVFYRFGDHHPLAGTVLYATTGAAAAAVGVGACIGGGCEAIGAAIATSEACQWAIDNMNDEGSVGASSAYSDDSTVGEILEGKLGSVKNAPLPPGSPSWADISDDTLGQIKAGAKQGLPGYKTILKLLRDNRFNKP